MERISRGVLPPPSRDTYTGDFEQGKEALNRCIEAVARLVRDSSAPRRKAVEGDLSQRADETKHEGEFRKVIHGVNSTLDAVLAPATRHADPGAARPSRPHRPGSRELPGRPRQAGGGGGYRRPDSAAGRRPGGGCRRTGVGASGRIARRPGRRRGRVAAGRLARGDRQQPRIGGVDDSAGGGQRSAGRSLATTARTSAPGWRGRHGADDRCHGRRSGRRPRARRRSSRTSTRSPSRPTSSPSTRRSRPPAPATRAAASRWWPRRCARCALRSKEAANKTEALIRESVTQAGEGEATARHVNGQAGGDPGRGLGR